VSYTQEDPAKQTPSPSGISPLEWFAMMYGVYKAMPESERQELFSWEKEHLDGSGDIGTSDWPGWEKYIGLFPKSDLSQSQRARSGFVYLIKIPSGEYKIGRSNDVGRRMQDFSTSSPHAFQLVHKIVADDMVEAERLLHKKFLEKSVKGEWFNLSSADLEYICEIVSFNSGEFIKPLAKSGGA